MPIENEFKFVLDLDEHGVLRRTLRAHKGVVEQRIQQAYLTKGVRIRRTHDVASGGVEYDLTFKRKVAGHVVEIPAPISKTDYARLWTTRECDLEKTRFKYAEARLHWDVDFFGDRGDPYFAMAEVEMPPELERSIEIPRPSEVIADYVLHVAGKENGFSSRRLCDPAYAEKMMKALHAARDRRLDAEAGRGMAMVA
jgi:CYTH domain-containing protein